MSALLIAGATVFTGTGDLLMGHSVLVEDGRISALGRDVPAPRGAEVVDAQGQFLMAGLIDVHSHLALPDVPERPEPHPDTPFLAARAAREKLASGVTTVRDVAGNNHVDLALRGAIQRGDVEGPRMFAAGRAISATGGHIHYWTREADGPDEIRKAVREQVKAGADLVKLMLSGGSANVGEEPDRMQLQADEIHAAVVEAKAAGRKVAAHAHPPRAIATAAEAGVASIEHGALLDDEAIDALVRFGTYLVPTQAVYQRIADNVDGWPVAKAEIAQGIVAHKRPALKKAMDAGVKIGIGTDSGRHFPAGAIADEMIVIHEIGMPADQVLLAATAHNAQLIGIEHEIGTVDVGKRADLVLFGGDVLADLRQLKDVRLVVQGGRPIHPEALLMGQSPKR